MRKDRRLLTMIVVLGIMAPLVVVGGGTKPAEAAARASWTVMVYMSGDNNLENYIVKDLESELADTGSTAAVQVVALADRGPGRDTSRGDWRGTKLFHVTKGMQATAANAVEGWGERNMGDPKTLVRFVTWAKTHFPADHYALYLWGHSWSWHPGYTMQDDSSRNSLNPHEIAAALPELGFIDMVGYDGCNAASIEAQTLWRGHAAAIAHSQEWVNMDGLEYELILAALNANPEMSADELAVITSRTAGTNQERTWSAVALDERWDALLAAVDAWSLALATGMESGQRAKYDRALRATQHFVDAPMDRDLYDLAAEINARVDDPEIMARGEAVMAAVEAVVLDEWHREDYAGANGITIYVVAGTAMNDTFAYYRKLGFAKATHWDEFLARYRRS